MATKKKKTQTKSMIDYIRRWHEPQIKKTSKKKKYIKSNEVRQLVAKQLGNKLSRNFGLYVADSQYYCTPLTDSEEIIRASAVDRKTWVRDRFDCDDFAHVLKAHFAEAAYKDGTRRASHCFGIVWGSLPGPHAINWMINSDGKLRFIEPQNDRVFFPRKKDKDIYFMLV